MAKIAVLAQKRPFLEPKKIKIKGRKTCFWPKKKANFGPEKRTKIVFSLKLHFLHFLSKFRGKKAKNYKNTAKKGVFGPKN